VVRTLERLSIHEYLLADLPLDAFLRACAAAGVRSVALLRRNVAAFGVERAAALLDELGIRVTSYASAGYWATDRTPEGEPWGLADSLCQLDVAVRLGAPLVVLVAGPLDPATRDLDGARSRVARGIPELAGPAAERGLRVAIEPLHPVFCADRSVVTSLEHALDLVAPASSETVGVALDSYHVWWDHKLDDLVRRAGPRIFAVHVSDFVLPLSRDRRRRGLMGEGCIDLAGFRRAVEAAGYGGPYEVEVANEELSALPPVQAVGRVVDAYRDFMA
jgi:sugar phosphate isomerase/epimerase